MMFHPSPVKPYVEPNIFVEHQNLIAVKNRHILWGIFSRVDSFDDYINANVLPKQCFLQTLSGNLEEYARGQNWKCKKASHVYTNSLQKGLDIKTQHKVPDTDTLAQASLSSAYVMLKQAKLR